MGVIAPVVASISTPNRFIATAISLCNSMRGLGGAVGLVISSSVFESKLKAELPEQITKGALAAGLPPISLGALLQAFASGDDAAYAKVPGYTTAIGEAVKASAADAYAIAFRFFWVSLIPFGIVDAIAACFIQSTKSQITLQVASPVQERHGQHHKEVDAQLQRVDM